MIIYLIIFFLIALLIKYVKKEKMSYIEFIILLLLIIVAGLRDGIGTDYNMYKSFYFFPTQSAASKVEIGFIYLIKLSHSVFMDKYYLFFLLCSFITILPIYLIMKKKSNYPMLSLLFFIGLGFYTMSFNMIRQFIAIAIIIYALKFIEEKKIYKYVLSVIIASFFHITAITMLPMYLWTKLDINKRVLKIIFAVFLFFGVFFTPVFNYIVNNIPQYAMYKSYSNVEAGLGTYLINLIYLFIIYFIIKYKKYMITNNFEKICMNISVFAVPMIALSLKNILFARMIYYFFIPALIPFANILNFFKIKNTQNIINFMLIVILLILYVMNIISFNDVYPYTSIFK